MSCSTALHKVTVSTLRNISQNKHCVVHGESLGRRCSDTWHPHSGKIRAHVHTEKHMLFLAHPSVCVWSPSSQKTQLDRSQNEEVYQTLRRRKRGTRPLHCRGQRGKPGRQRWIYIRHAHTSAWWDHTHKPAHHFSLSLLHTNTSRLVFTKICSHAQPIKQGYRHAYKSSHDYQVWSALIPLSPP